MMQVSALTWLIGSLIMAINLYFLSRGFIKLLLHNNLNTVEKVSAVIFGFSAFILYLASIAYLVIRKNKQRSCHLLALTGTQNERMSTESSRPRDDIVSMQLPRRPM